MNSLLRTGRLATQRVAARAVRAGASPQDRELLLSNASKIRADGAGKVANNWEKSRLLQRYHWELDQLNGTDQEIAVAQRYMAGNFLENWASCFVFRLWIN